MDYKKLKENDIFPIPVGEDFDKGADSLLLVYSPLTDNAVLVTPEYVDMMEQYMENQDERTLLPKDVVEAMEALTDFDNRKKPAPLAENPMTYTRMAILPNNVCNFKCSYCYSAHGRSGKVISKDVLKVSLDHFIDNKC